MGLSHLKDSDWREFMERFPEAQEFLLIRSLTREYQTICASYVEEKASVYTRVRYGELRRILEGKGFSFVDSNEIRD